MLTTILRYNAPSRCWMSFKTMKNVLIACEYSGRVRDAMQAMRPDLDVISCDILPSDKVAIENPVGILNSYERWPELRGAGLALPQPQYIQPWQFGQGTQKKTGLWIKGLPPLEPTDIVEGRRQDVWLMGPSRDRAKKRSITPQGIADAMAQQWGTLI